MSSETRDIARKLSRIQTRLRKELLEELDCHTDDIDAIFDPYSYSPVVHEIKEKYLSRLYVLQALIQELAHLNQGHRSPPVKVASVHADTTDKLVKAVNEKLAGLNGVKVMDVKFLQERDSEDCVAVICYISNPFTESKNETAAWM